MSFACVAETKDRARCRETVEQNGALCPTHEYQLQRGGTVRRASAPDRVLVKFRVNPNWTRRLSDAGIPFRMRRNFLERDTQHAEQAEAVRRDPLRYRAVADSGVPVFGRDGIAAVVLSDLITEMKEAGYVVSDIHLEPTRNEGMNVLVLSITNEGGIQSSLPEVVDNLLMSCWGHVHVWANPPDADGKITHTVNLAHRKDGEVNRALRFASGLWAYDVKE